MAEIVQLSMYPDEKLAETIRALARDRDLSVSQTLLDIVRTYVERADFLFLLEARRRELITHEEAMAKLELLVERDGDVDGRFPLGRGGEAMHGDRAGGEDGRS